MLFFWEEEIVRWRLLDDEEKEIKKVMSDACTAGGNQGIVPELRVALERLRMTRGKMPSQRLADGFDTGEELPEYRARG